MIKIKFTKETISQFVSKIKIFFKNWAVVLFLAILAGAILLDLFVYYKYVYLVEKQIPEVSVSIAKLPAAKFKSVLEDINKREENFRKVMTEEPGKDIFR